MNGVAPTARGTLLRPEAATPKKPPLLVCGDQTTIRGFSLFSAVAAYHKVTEGRCGFFDKCAGVLAAVCAALKCAPDGPEAVQAECGFSLHNGGRQFVIDLPNPKAFEAAMAGLPKTLEGKSLLFDRAGVKFVIAIQQGPSRLVVSKQPEFGSISSFDIMGILPHLQAKFRISMPWTLQHQLRFSRSQDL